MNTKEKLSQLIERLEMFTDSQLEYRPEVLFAVAQSW